MIGDLAGNKVHVNSLWDGPLKESEWKIGRRWGWGCRIGILMFSFRPIFSNLFFLRSCRSSSVIFDFSKGALVSNFAGNFRTHNQAEPTGSEWPASRHRIASVFASWERIAEDFRSENPHRQGFCIASHRHLRAYPAPPLTSHRCPHRAIWATQHRIGANPEKSDLVNFQGPD